MAKVTTANAAPKGTAKANTGAATAKVLHTARAATAPLSVAAAMQKVVPALPKPTTGPMASGVLWHCTPQGAASSRRGAVARGNMQTTYATLAALPQPWAWAAGVAAVALNLPPPQGAPRTWRNGQLAYTYAHGYMRGLATYHSAIAVAPAGTAKGKAKAKGNGKASAPASAPSAPASAPSTPALHAGKLVAKAPSAPVSAPSAPASAPSTPASANAAITPQGLASMAASVPKG